VVILPARAQAASDQCSLQNVVQFNRGAAGKQLHETKVRRLLKMTDSSHWLPIDSVNTFSRPPS